MGRKKLFNINIVIDQSWLNAYNLSKKMMDSDKKEFEKLKEYTARLNSEIKKVKVERFTKEVRESIAKRYGLYSIDKAYLAFNKITGIKRRAFMGRVERGVIPVVKVGRFRYIPSEVMDYYVGVYSKYQSLTEAYKKLEGEGFIPNLRAFIGRAEKGSVPNVKIGTRKFIPNVVVDGLTKVAKYYYDVPTALEKINDAGLKISSNAFERRLDRGRIPFIKIGGKRYIHKSVLNEMITQEIQKRSR
ncbi:MAG: hypothetical protein QW035_03350 [Candidatus Anstonellales archaeon]